MNDPSNRLILPRRKGKGNSAGRPKEHPSDRKKAQRMKAGRGLKFYATAENLRDAGWNPDVTAEYVIVGSQGHRMGKKGKTRPRLLISLFYPDEKPERDPPSALAVSSEDGTGEAEGV